MYYDHRNVENARKLRKDMTPWERKLWYCFLKEYPVRFQRQKEIDKYIVDFYCAAAKLVVELDGSQHYESEERQRDAERDQYMSDLGLAVLRFSNADVDQHFDSVCAAIDRAVQEREGKGRGEQRKPSPLGKVPRRGG